MLIGIAVANAILWSGVIVTLLLVLARDARQTEAQLNRLESRARSDDNEPPPTA